VSWISCGRYAEDFDIPVRAPKCPPPVPRVMFSQGHVSVRKLVQSYDVNMCHVLRACDMCHVLRALRFALARLVSLGSFGSCGWLKCRWVNVNVVCRSFISKSDGTVHGFLVYIVVDCRWKTWLYMLPAPSSSNTLLIFWLPLECHDDSSLRLYLYSFFLYRL